MANPAPPPARNLPPLRGTRVLVVGLGRSGLAAARHLLAHGAQVVANDRRSKSELGPEAELLGTIGVKIVDGGHAPDVFEAAELIVLSPGVPLDLPPLTAAIARGVPVCSEIDLVASTIGARSIAITGSNGKSTTTALVAAILQAAGLDGVACGNFGLPLCEAAQGDHQQRWYAIELSSFQLDITFQLRAAATILLNIQADHLDRHGDYPGYRAAKYRIATLRAAGGPLVLAIDDPEVAALAPQARPPVLSVSVERSVPHGGMRQRDALVLHLAQSDESLIALGDLPIPGRHNQINILAAAVACRAVGIALDAIRRGVQGFRALPHRLQEIAQVDGVRFVDDSKATNVGSAIEAIRALAGAHLFVLLGGRDKAADFRPLAAALRDAHADAITFGEAGPQIAAVLAAAGVTALQRCSTLEDAVRAASAAARPGDVVLLSPACASFDAYSGYAARGDHFVNLTRRLADRP